jgi:hypothetical protein
MEKNKEYVVRKLNEPMCNVAGVTQHLGLTRSTMLKLKQNGDVKSSVIEALYVYFKNSNE